jgi:hypothetical protein
MLTNKEIAHKIDSEARDSLNKFLYFIFSVTTVSIGFMFTQLKYIEPHWIIIIWFSAVFPLCLSLFFGAASIHHNIRSLTLTSTALAFDEIMTSVHAEEESSFRKWLLFEADDFKGNTIPENIRAFLAKKISDISNLHKMNGREYIKSENILELKRLCTDGIYESVGLINESTTCKTAVIELNKSKKKIMFQLYCLPIGYSFFVIWFITCLIIKK